METAVINKISGAARVKADYAKGSTARCLVYSMLAGAYVGIGITLIMTLGAQISGNEYTAGLTKLVMGSCVGLALSMCIMCGSDLYTGNTMTLGLGAMTGRVTWREAFRVWGINIIGNLAGAFVVAGIMRMTGLLNGEEFGTFCVSLSATKMSLTPVQAFFRAILCNFCVGVAAWCAQKLQSESAKLIMIWWALFAFIGIGLEHSVANMTLLMLGLFSPYAAENAVVGWGGFVYNLVPVIIGNWIGGVVLFALPYYYCSTTRAEQSGRDND